MANLEVVPLSERFLWDTDLICSTRSRFNVLTSKVNLNSICYEPVYLKVVYDFSFFFKRYMQT